MTLIKNTYNRRSFLKASAAAGGGFLLGFNWLAGCTPAADVESVPKEWFDINAYLQVADNGMVTIMSPNPEIGQNVKTSMPMVVAEELDVSWDKVVVRQAPLNTEAFIRQVAGGSQSLRSSWQSLRRAGATARQMLVNAAARQWGVDPSTCTTENGVVRNDKGESLTYGAVASAAAGMEIPEEVQLKDPSAFRLIGTDVRNVDMEEIITGKPLFGYDLKKEGMVYAVALRPPAFGQKLISFNDAETRSVNGVTDVIRFGDKIAVLAGSTWAAMKGQKALRAEWEDTGLLESTEYHDEKLLELLDTPAAEARRADGDVKAAFAAADQVIERVYEAPFLPHNCLEPMNFFAHVTDEKAELIGPIQTPERTRKRVAELLGREESSISIDMPRMGGGFGRRLNGDFVLEAAEISSLAGKPVLLVYTREDDMTAGIYRPASKYKFRAAIKDGKLAGYHLTGAGVNMGNSTRENNFPAGAVPNYLVESHNLESNITTGAWRAPVTNFLAFAEQAFFDEVAQAIGVDPVQFRLDLFEQARNNPVGEIHYDIDKSVGVIKLAAEKAAWGQTGDAVYQGFSTYYAHNTYVAEVADVVVEDDVPRVKKVTAAVDCGIVINPIAALNQAEGGIIDGIGHAMFGELSFRNGRPQQNNFNQYRLIKMGEQPEVEVHFVKSLEDPTGLGEPTLPPAAAAVANALHAATGVRMYSQPFAKAKKVLG